MSNFAETFQNDISQLFNERGLLRTELITKEKLLTDALLQKNALSQSLKQIRADKDDLFTNYQKLKQEKLAIEAEKSASNIHVTILKEEKTLLEQKLYQITERHEQSRIQIEELTRQNSFLQIQARIEPLPSISHVPSTIDQHQFDELKKRILELEQSHEILLERHKRESQLLRDESTVKDDQINNLQRLLSQYEQKIESDEQTRKELEQRLQNFGRSCRSQMPDKLTLSDDELRTIEADPNCSSILAIYRSSKSLFDILIDYSLLQKQNESLTNTNEKIESQRRYNENILHQIQTEFQQLRVQYERLQFVAESRQTDYEQAIRDKQTLFKEKIELDRELQQKLRAYDDCIDDRNNMRAQIFHLLESGNIKGQLRSLLPDADLIDRQGVVTFASVEELYEQYMKSLADIRDTDRFILELEETHSREMSELSQREYTLKDNIEELRSKLDQTRTDLNIESLAKQVLDRQHPSISTGSSSIQTEMTLIDVKTIEDDLKRLEQKRDEYEIERIQIQDEMKFLQQKFFHAQNQNWQDKQKITDLQRIVDESLQRTQSLLADVQTAELVCEQLKEQNRNIQNEHDQLLANVSNLKNEIDKLRSDNQQMSQLQEQLLDRIKRDIESKTTDSEDISINVKLQQSVEELNTIMKDCVKQTELTTVTPTHIASLTKLEILYRQLQQRHQHDLEQHFAISESLKIKIKDAQADVQRIQRECEQMRSNFDEEKTKFAVKIVELESKLRNADTTTVLTRLLPSATLENRLKEEEERTQQLRNWTNKLTEKIEHIQKQMGNEKKEYEEKMDEMRKELRESRNECDMLEKRLTTAQEEQQRSMNEFKDKEELLEMEIFKLKTESDSAQVTNMTLKETIIIKEDDIRHLHERIMDYETKMSNLEKEYYLLKEKCARQTKEHNLPISQPPSPLSTHQEVMMNIDEISSPSVVHDPSTESKTPLKRRRIVSSSERTPMRLRSTRSQSADCQSDMFSQENDEDEMAEDNDDALSTCSEPPTAKKRKRRPIARTELTTLRLPAVNEEGDSEDGVTFSGNTATPPSYNLRSKIKRMPKLQPNQTT